MPTKTLVINPGESAVLDKSKKILGVYYSGNSFANTECTLPAPGQLKCYVLNWAASQDAGSTDVLETSDPNVYIKAIIVAGVRYNLPHTLIAPGYYSDHITNEEFLATWIPTVVPAGLIIVDSHSQSTVANRYHMAINFLSPDTIGSTVGIVLSAPGFGADTNTPPTVGEIIQYAVACDSCCTSITP